MLTRQRFESGTTKVTFTERFEYDLAGQLSGVREYADFLNDDLIETWTFGYDAEGRLEQAMKSIQYGFKLERDAQSRIVRLVRIHPDFTTPSAWRVEYRASTNAFEPDPVKDFFMTDPFSVYP